MPIQNHNPSQHSPMFVPYPFRPFWQPNSWAASPSGRHPELERLAQKLDTAEKKIDEYLKSIASLSVELKRYQDIICLPCKEKIFCASLATASPLTPTGFNGSSSQSIFAALSEPASTTGVQEPPLGAHNQSSGISQQAGLHSSGPRSSNTNPSSFIVTTSNPQATVAYVPTKTIPTISPYPADTNFEPSQPAVPSIPETATDARPTQPNPGWSVGYNTELEENPGLHVANTFTFTAPVFCAKFSHDGNYLAMGLGNGEAHIHNMITGSKIVLAERSATVFYTEVAEAPSAIWAVRFSRNNKYIATGGSKGQINIWEIERKRVCASFKHKEFVRSLDLSPDGRFLVSASYDDSVCVWCIRDGSRRRLWHGPSDYESVAFSPDGRFVAAGNGGGFLRIWDARTGQLVAKFSGHDDDVRSVVFAPDGQTIASGGDTLKCWDFRSLSLNRRSGRKIMEGNTTIQLNQIFEFKGHKSSITAVSFSSDNQWVVSSSLDRNINILDARTGAWVFTLKAQMNDIWAADFSPAGRYLVSGGRDRPQFLEGRVVLYVVDFVK